MVARVRILFPLLALGTALLVACGSGASSSAPATVTEAAASAAGLPTPPPSPSPAAVAATVDGQRILVRDRHLADDIGVRNAGSPQEQQAIDYAADQLRSFGYDVSLQPFSVSTESSRQASLTVHSAPDRTLDAVPLGQSGSGDVRGELALGGRGAPDELRGISGKIALIERGDLTFQDKVANAQAAKARAVIIFNNAPGNFLGSLSSAATIPAVSISRENGQALSKDLDSGPDDVQLVVAPAGTATSHNLIAKPPGRDCETISGGHIDSIVGPGANDNATGTATVLEIASVIASNGHMGNHCFVLFGGEELGLLGSKAYVQSLDSAARSRLRAMFNYDMVGVGDDGWVLIGNPDLQQRGQSLSKTLGIEEVALGRLPANTGSDHASFISGGIPALMVHRLTDNLLHTPQDVSSRVRAELLEQAARLGVALLESYNGGG